MIGNTGDLPEEVWHKLEGLIHRTAANTGVTLVLALSYGARWEIVEAARRLIADYKTGRVADTEEVTDELFARYLTTAGMPDPDLLIRTSGECRYGNVPIRSFILSTNFGLILKKMIYIWQSVIFSNGRDVLE